MHVDLPVNVKPAQTIESTSCRTTSCCGTAPALEPRSPIRGRRPPIKPIYAEAVSCCGGASIWSGDEGGFALVMALGHHGRALDRVVTTAMFYSTRTRVRETSAERAATTRSGSPRPASTTRWPSSTSRRTTRSNRTCFPSTDELQHEPAAPAARLRQRLRHLVRDARPRRRRVWTVTAIGDFGIRRRATRGYLTRTLTAKVTVTPTVHAAAEQPVLELHVSRRTRATRATSR